MTAIWQPDLGNGIGIGGGWLAGWRSVARGGGARAREGQQAAMVTARYAQHATRAAAW